MLYGALTRTAASLGYDSVITYTLATEPGVSLRASGWVKDADIPSDDWSKRQRLASGHKLTLFDAPKMPTGPKIRWRKTLRP